MSAPVSSLRNRRILSAAILVLVALPIIAAWVIDVENFREPLERRLEATLARDVSLGALKLSMSPRLAIRLHDVVVADADGVEEFISAPSLDVGVRWAPLLAGRLAITTLHLESPVIRLERDAEGAWNLQRFLADIAAARTAAAREAKSDQPQRKGKSGRAKPLKIKELKIVSGRILVRDASVEPPLEMNVDGIEANLRGFGRPSKTIDAGARLDERAQMELAGEFQSADRFDVSVSLQDASPAVFNVLAGAFDFRRVRAFGEGAWDGTARISRPDGVLQISEGRLDLQGIAFEFIDGERAAGLRGEVVGIQGRRDGQADHPSGRPSWSGSAEVRLTGGSVSSADLAALFAAAGGMRAPDGGMGAADEGPL